MNNILNKIIVLSLFDGISGARQALKELNIDCDYYSSEIDKWAIQISKANHPDILQIGDIRKFQYKNLAEWQYINNDGDEIYDKIPIIEILVAGFPCQSFSVAGNRKGFGDDRGQLFFEMLRILKEVKPKLFILENVASMKKTDKEAITKELWDIEPVMINSALVTAQQRKRLYWIGKLVNSKYQQVKIDQPEDQEIYLKDIIEDGFVDRDKSHAIISSIGRTTDREYFKKNQGQLVFDKPSCIVGRRINPKTNKRDDYNKEIKITQSLEVGAGNKSRCLSTVEKDCLISSKEVGRYKDYIKKDYRKLTIAECEKLQGFPKGYCSVVSKTQAYKALGNSFTIPVIRHILKQLNFDKPVI